MRSSCAIGPAAVALGIVVSLAGCDGRDDLDGRRRPLAGLPERPAEHALPGGAGRVAYDFFDNRAAAAVHQDGDLLIDAGTADFAKYAEGMYRSPWHTGVDDGDERVALVDGLGGELYLPIDDDPGGVGRTTGGGVRISLRARAAAERQLVSVFLNEQRLGEISMPTTEWNSYDIEAPAQAVAEGENKLRFYFRHAGDIGGARTAAAISRITVGDGGAGAGGGLRAGQVTRGGKALSALELAGAGRISYYVRVPAGSPVLAAAAAGEGELSVRLSDGDGGAELWRGPGSDSWTDLQLELGDWAGRIVRIDFAGSGAAAWGRPRLIAEAAGEVAGDAVGPADHVIIWAVSSLRDDRAGAPAVPTPGFSRLLDEGVRFSRARSAAPAPGPAHVAMMTGRLPEGGVVPEGAETLARRFRAAGHHTALVSGNGFVHDEAGFARGFDVYRNPMRRRHAHGARVLWQEAARVLRAHADGRTFLYLATVEPHLPYTPSSDSLEAEWSGGQMRFSPARTGAISEALAAGRERLSAEERAYVEALYDAEVRDADAAFADMLADLDALDVRERTAIILVGDHGQELFERGGFGHGAHLHQEVVRVPLAIAAPGLAGGTVSEAPASGIDVHATALELAGIAPHPTNQGRALLSVIGGGDELEPRPLFSNLPGRGRALELGGYKLVVPLAGAHSLYDLEVDPEERVDLMGQRPLAERYLRTVFGIGTAYRQAWSAARWGSPAAVTAAFAADHGL